MVFASVCTSQANSVDPWSAHTHTHTNSRHVQQSSSRDRIWHIVLARDRARSGWEWRHAASARAGTSVVWVLGQQHHSERGDWGGWWWLVWPKIDLLITLITALVTAYRAAGLKQLTSDQEADGSNPSGTYSTNLLVPLETVFVAKYPRTSMNNTTYSGVHEAG